MNAILKEKPRHGVFRDISEAQYHSDKTTFSSTLLKKMKFPANAKHYIENPPEYKEEFAIGRAIHAFVLEPEKFASDFLIGINAKRNSNDTRQEWADWYGAHGWSSSRDWIIEKKSKAATWNPEFEAQTGKVMITPEKLEEIKLMSDSVAANPEAMMLLTNGRAEQSYFWQDDETELELRCRPDFENDDFVTDLKSCASANPRNFKRDALNFDYVLQAAFYSSGIYQVTGKRKPFVFLAIEKKAPYLTSVISYDDATMEKADELYHYRLRKLYECLQSGQWSGYKNELQASAPDYYFEEMDY